MATRKLRTGFSTGTAAAAAAKAALTALLSGRKPGRIPVKLPSGDDLPVAVAEVRLLSGREASATVIKDAGDDPDVTHGAAIQAQVSISDQDEPAEKIVIEGGPGVGRVTRPGLPVAVGQAAINPVPRTMIAEGLRQVWGEFHPDDRPCRLNVTISVPDGERLARRTLNPRLGIVGGLSILGTTGLVKPFSHEAYTATIASALDVARAGGLEEVVLTTGGRSEKLALKLRSDLPETAFIQIADYFGLALAEAGRRCFARLGLVSFFGKAVKQAQGLADTHAHKAQLQLTELAGWLEEAGADPELVREVAAANTALQALDLMRSRRSLDLTAAVGRRVLSSARKFAGPGLDLWLAIVDYDGSCLYQNREDAKAC
ncbi:MAG: cobalt-precorrin-5B (C(1))-methyltransferase [Thermodesulfobacteriota bacterium]